MEIRNWHIAQLNIATMLGKDIKDPVMEKLFVVKIGGNILDNAIAQQLFLQQFAAVSDYSCSWSAAEWSSSSRTCR